MAEINNLFSLNFIHCKSYLHFILENPVIIHLQIRHFSFSIFILEQYIKRGLWLVIMSLLKEPDTNNEPFPHHKTEKKCRPIGNCPLFRSITCVFLSVCWYVLLRPKPPAILVGEEGFFMENGEFPHFQIYQLFSSLSNNHFLMHFSSCTKQYRKYDFSFPKVNQLRGKRDLAG